MLRLCWTYLISNVHIYLQYVPCFISETFYFRENAIEFISMKLGKFLAQIAHLTFNFLTFYLIQ